MKSGDGLMVAADNNARQSIISNAVVDPNANLQEPFADDITRMMGEILQTTFY